MSIRESGAQAFECLREASKMLSIRTIGNGWTGNSTEIGKYEMSIRESAAQAFECLRGASKMLSIRTIGNGWTGNSRSENMKCRSVNLVLKRSSSSG
jgi:hypothetical protein